MTGFGEPDYQKRCLRYILYGKVKVDSYEKNGRGKPLPGKAEGIESMGCLTCQSHCFLPREGYRGNREETATLAMGNCRENYPTAEASTTKYSYRILARFFI